MGPILFALLLFVGCSTAPTAEPPKRPCINQPPPAGARFSPEHGGNGRCDSAFYWCLEESDVLAIAESTNRMRDWAAEAWEKCGR